MLSPICPLETLIIHTTPPFLVFQRSIRPFKAFYLILMYKSVEHWIIETKHHWKLKIFFLNVIFFAVFYNLNYTDIKIVWIFWLSQERKIWRDEISSRNIRVMSVGQSWLDKFLIEVAVCSCDIRAALFAAHRCCA